MFFYFTQCLIIGSSGGTVSCYTVLQAGRSRVRFTKVSLDFFDINLPAALMFQNAFKASNWYFSFKIFILPTPFLSHGLCRPGRSTMLPLYLCSCFRQPMSIVKYLCTETIYFFISTNELIHVYHTCPLFCRGPG